MGYFFRYDKVKYKNPLKFPEIAEEMEQLKKAGQDARLEFTMLTEAFQKNFKSFRMDRVSQWMNPSPSGKTRFLEILYRRGAR